jgi:serine/threonine protein kinase
VSANAQNPHTSPSSNPHKTLTSDNGKKTWNLIRSIGKGGCGEVFLASEPNKSKLLAAKFIKEKKLYDAELQIMRKLNRHPQGRGKTPQLIAACKKDQAIVMQYLCDTVAQRFEKSNYTFSLKTILMLAMDMVIIY